METNAERRKRKLRDLCAKHGIDVVAKRAGVSQPSLDQILKGTLLPPKKDGTRSPRSLGDAAAHAIEDALKLGRGWFDRDDTPLTVKEPGAPYAPPPKPADKFADPVVATPEEAAHLAALRWLLPADREATMRGVAERAQEQLEHVQRMIGRVAPKGKV